MSKIDRRADSFRKQLRQSMDELRSIMGRGQSPSGGGRFTVRTLEVIEPSVYDAKAVRRVRQSLNLSQALFARLLGVSGSLVRAWELGTRCPAPMARRVLDHVRANPHAFARLVRASHHGATSRSSRLGNRSAATRDRKVA